MSVLGLRRAREARDELRAKAETLSTARCCDFGIEASLIQQHGWDVLARAATSLMPQIVQRAIELAQAEVENGRAAAIDSARRFLDETQREIEADINAERERA